MKISFNVKSATVKVGEQVVVQATGVTTSYGVKNGMISAKNKIASVIVNSTGEGANTSSVYEDAAFNAEIGFGELKELAGQARDFFDGFAKSKATTSYVSASEDFASSSDDRIKAVEITAFPTWAVARIIEDEDGFSYEVYEQESSEDYEKIHSVMSNAVMNYTILRNLDLLADFATFKYTFEQGIAAYMSKTDVDTLDIYSDDIDEIISEIPFVSK